MRTIKLSKRYSINVINNNMADIAKSINEITPKINDMLSLSKTGRQLAGKFYLDSSLDLAEQLVDNYDKIYELSNAVVTWAKTNHTDVTGWSGSLYQIYHKNKQASDPALRALNYAGKALGSNAVRFKELRTRMESDLEVIKQIRRTIKKARTASRNENQDKAHYLAQEIRTTSLQIINEITQLNSHINDCADLLTNDKDILQKITDKFNETKNWDWDSEITFVSS